MPTEIYAALFGAIVGAWITYRLALRLNRIQHAFDRALADREARRRARAALRAAFAPTLAFIFIARTHNAQNWPDIDAHIKNALLAHGAAIEKFRPFVADSDKSTPYQKAWEDYHNIAAMDKYSLAAEARINNTQPDELLEQKIHSILSFAKN
jgi:hypothetical protein